MGVDLGVAKGYLELDLKNFDTAVTSAEKSLKSIEQGGKLAQSGLSLLASESTKAGNVFQQAADKSRSLSSQLETAKQKSELYKTSIDGLNQVIKKSQDQQKELGGKITEVSNKYEKAQDASKQMAEALKKERSEYKSLQTEADKLKETLGEESEEYKKAREAVDKHKEALSKSETQYKKSVEKTQKYRNELVQLQSKHGDLTMEVDHSKEKITEFQTELNNTKADINNLSKELDDSRNRFKTWGTALQGAGSWLESAGQKISSAGSALTLGVTTPLVAAGTLAVKSATDFESAFAGVKKTVDASDQQLKVLKQGIIDMSLELPTAATEIAGVSEAAGQLGIQTDNILDFTRVMIDLGESTNLSANDAATTLARFANITGMSQEKFGNLGSVIVDLGNHLATTESEIAAMGLRLAGAGSQVGMTEAQILSFAGALSSVGIEAEAGGSAFSKVMINMQLAVETGTESLAELQAAAENSGVSWDTVTAAINNGGAELKNVAGQMGLTNTELRSMYDEAIKSAGSLEDFADVAGMTAEEFSAAFKEDAAGALISFIEGLSTAEDRGISAIKVLDDMDITEVRMRDSLLRAAGASDVFSDALDLGSTAWEENNALTKEASQRYETTESKMKIAKNTIVEAGRSLGETLLPVIADIAESVAGLAKEFGKLPDETKRNILMFAGFAAAAGPALKVLGKVTEGVGGFTHGIGKLLEKAKSAKPPLQTAAEAVEGVGSKAVKASGGLGGVTGVLSSLIGPAGIAALAAGALIGVGTACYMAYQEAKKNDLAEHFGNIKLSAEEVEDVAERLTTTDWTVRLNAYMDAQSQLEEFEESIEATVAELNKTEWKVSVGLELTEQEQQDYISNTEAYVKECADYISQKGYTINLAIKAAFKDGSTSGAGLSAFTDSFYSQFQSDFTELGDRYSQLVNDSFANGTFNKNKVKLDQMRSNCKI